MPYATLRGPIDSNVFAIIGATSNTLKRAGFRPEAKEFTEKALNCASYHAVLALAQEYVEFDI